MNAAASFRLMWADHFRKDRGTSDMSGQLPKVLSHGYACRV